MGSPAQRVVLMAVAAAGTLALLYPRMPAPRPLFGGDGPGARMPTYAPSPGRTERMPVAPPLRPLERAPQPPAPPTPWRGRVRVY